MRRTDENEDSPLRGRVRGMLYGVAFGDAMGAPVEKLLRHQIAERYGWVDTLDHGWHKNLLPPAERNDRTRGHGTITDDTLMTLSLMDAYAETERHLDAWDMAGAMVRQIAWTPRWIPEMGREAMLIERLFYPEKWIFQRHQLANCDPRLGGVGNMVNCGAAMYIAPIGVVNACDPKAAYDEAIAFASGHQESYGLEAAGVLAACIAAAVALDATLDGVIEVALGLGKDGTRTAIVDILAAATRMKAARPDYDTVVADFHAIIARYSPGGDDIIRSAEQLGRAASAYTPSRLFSIEELPLALGFAVLNDGAFHASIIDGINSGRDTDSIGVMAGAILGALHGESVIEETDLKKLNTANRLDLIALADRFTATATRILRADMERNRKRDAQRCALWGNDA